MEFPLSINLSAEAASVLALLLLFLYYLLRWKNTPKKQPPQPSGSWPFIGHLPILGAIPHLTLAKLADQYGSIFTIKLGMNQAIVVSSERTAKECLGTNDKVFANRPHSIFVDHLGYNFAMLGFSPYGPYWREMRKIIAIELLSNHKLDMLKHVRISEVRSAIKDVYESCFSKGKSSPVDMKQWFNQITLNASVKLIAGKSLKEFYQGEEYDRCVNAIRDFFVLSGTFVPADALPFLRWFDIGGHEKAMKKAFKEIDSVAHGWLDEHKRTRDLGERKEQQDFMDVMLGIFETGLDVPTEFDADTIIKANSLAMILGGTDTTAVTLTWALSLLINNSDSLRKVQNEIDGVVGKERQVEESDLKRLVYLQAVTKETMRLYPAAPLSVPREAIADCTVSGFHIPAGTRLFVNLYKLHRDPEFWDDPLEFRPERFLTTHADYDVRGKYFDYIPFGSGRRVCPGISFAIQTMQFALASLLHCFEVSTPSGEPVDMTEGPGMTNLKATPLEVVLNPRLPGHIYSNPCMAVE